MYYYFIHRFGLIGLFMCNNPKTIKAFPKKHFVWLNLSTLNSDNENKILLIIQKFIYCQAVVQVQEPKWQPKIQAFVG